MPLDFQRHVISGKSALQHAVKFLPACNLKKIFWEHAISPRRNPEKARRQPEKARRNPEKARRNPEKARRQPEKHAGS